MSSPKNVIFLTMNSNTQKNVKNKNTRKMKKVYLICK